MERFLCRKPSRIAADQSPWFENIGIGARVGLWDTALKFLSPGPHNDVTDHLALRLKYNFCLRGEYIVFYRSTV